MTIVILSTSTITAVMFISHIRHCHIGIIMINVATSIVYPKPQTPNPKHQTLNLDYSCCYVGAWPRRSSAYGLYRPRPL